mgnify:CR=1 FL=1
MCIVTFGYACMFIFFCLVVWYNDCVFFQAEDGIRDLVRSRGLGDVYKRQMHIHSDYPLDSSHDYGNASMEDMVQKAISLGYELSLIHI